MQRWIAFPGLFLVLLATARGEMRVSVLTETVGRHEVFEIEIIHDDAAYANPWLEVSVSALFSPARGETYAVDGFYYDVNRWRVRFAPLSEGPWHWVVRLTAPGGEWTAEGRFLCTPSSHRGFLRRHPANPFRLVYADGTLFPGIGIGDCIRDVNGSGDPLDDWGFDGAFRGRDNPGVPEYGWVVDLPVYLAAYGRRGAGFNLFRWSVDNCSFRLWDTISPAGNRYLVQEGLWGDRLVSALRAHGFAIWMTVFGFSAPLPNAAENPEEQEAIRHYLRYVVGRYGPYVDIWELLNEANVSDEWIAFVARALREIDPFDRLISTSWERPEHPLIEINAPHLYVREPEVESDTLIAQAIARHKRYGKPVVFAEQGNAGQNWDTRSFLRLRLRSWTAFFEEGILIFWNSSFAKDYRAPVAANIYLGPQERQTVRVLQDFAGEIDADATRFAPEVAPRERVRGYGLVSPKVVAVYFHHFASHDEPVSATVSLSLPRTGTARWVVPEDGRIAGAIPIGSGQQTLVTPPFVVDLALLIRLEPDTIP